MFFKKNFYLKYFQVNGIKGFNHENYGIFGRWKVEEEEKQGKSRKVSRMPKAP